MFSQAKKRCPGDTDGDSSRSHLVVPYRMHEGTAFQSVDQTAVRAFISSAMAEVGNDYMNGCIEFVDDTDAQGKSYFHFTSQVIINSQAIQISFTVIFSSQLFHQHQRQSRRWVRFQCRISRKWPSWATAHES